MIRSHFSEEVERALVECIERACADYKLGRIPRADLFDRTMECARRIAIMRSYQHREPEAPLVDRLGDWSLFTGKRLGYEAIAEIERRDKIIAAHLVELEKLRKGVS